LKKLLADATASLHPFIHHVTPKGDNDDVDLSPHVSHRLHGLGFS
jgi:hypothetical protein